MTMEKLKVALIVESMMVINVQQMQQDSQLVLFHLLVEIIKCKAQSNVIMAIMQDALAVL